jgi:hypothetical protein
MSAGVRYEGENLTLTILSWPFCCVHTRFAIRIEPKTEYLYTNIILHSFGIRNKIRIPELWNAILSPLQPSILLMSLLFRLDSNTVFIFTSSSASQEFTPKKNSKQPVEASPIKEIYTPNKGPNDKTSSSSADEKLTKGVLTFASSSSQIQTPNRGQSTPSSEDDLHQVSSCSHIKTPKKDSLNIHSSSTNIQTPKKRANQSGSSSCETTSGQELTPKNQRAWTQAYEKEESPKGEDLTRAYSAPARVQRRGQLEGHTSTTRGPNIHKQLDFELMDAAEDAGVDTSDPEYVHVRIRKSVFEELKLRQDSSRTRFTKHITNKCGQRRLLTKKQVKRQAKEQAKKMKKDKNKEIHHALCPR